jgi:hypothetical protein
MKVFISWSGAKSLAVAEVLREELPCLINELEIFVSSEDIEKGSAWFPKVATELDKSDFGIVCLTPENLQSRWVHFEAGVLAGKFSQKKVAPLLIGFEKYEQIPPPLSELNLTKFNKEDFFRLLGAINKNIAKPIAESLLSKTFERNWKHIADLIKEKIEQLPLSENVDAVGRSPEEMLEEILGIVRSLPNAQSENGISHYLKTLGSDPSIYGLYRNPEQPLKENEFRISSNPELEANPSLMIRLQDLIQPNK